MKKIINYILYIIEIVIVSYMLNYSIEDTDLKNINIIIIVFILMINFIIIDLLIEKLKK